MTMAPRLNRRALLTATLGSAVVAGTSLVALPEASAGSTSALTASLNSYLGTRTGTVGLALFDSRSGRVYTYNSFTNQTLSTVKVIIAATVCKRAEDRKVALTSSQQSLMSKMIRYSDNAATDSLLAQVGVANVQRVAGLFGMTNTRVQGQASGWWGYSTSTPLDMVRLENKIVWGSSVISRAHSDYIHGLMKTVTASQRWGVLGSLPVTPVNYGIKNGWGPMSGGYRLNSVGHVYGRGRSYNLAIFTRSPNGFSYGKETINRVGRIVYDNLVTPLSGTAGTGAY